MSEKKLNALEWVGLSAIAVPLVLVLFVPLLLFRAWAFLCLYGWFAIPAFGLPALNYPLAIGLLLLWDWLRPKSALKAEYADPVWHQTLAVFVSTLFALLFGWILKAWWL